MLTLICSFRRCARGTGSVHKTRLIFFSSKVWFATRKNFMIFLYWNIRLFRQERQSSSGDVIFIFFRHIWAENSVDLKFEYEKWLFVARKNPPIHESHRRSIRPIFSCGCFSRTQRKSVARFGEGNHHQASVVSLLGFWKRAYGWCVHERRVRIPRLWGFFLLFFITHCRVTTSTCLSSRTLFFSSSSFSDVKLALSHITSHLCQG